MHCIYTPSPKKLHIKWGLKISLDNEILGKISQFLVNFEEKYALKAEKYF